MSEDVHGRCGAGMWDMSKSVPTRAMQRTILGCVKFGGVGDFPGGLRLSTRNVGSMFLFKRQRADLCPAASHIVVFGPAIFFCKRRVCVQEAWRLGRCCRDQALICPCGRAQRPCGRAQWLDVGHASRVCRSLVRQWPSRCHCGWADDTVVLPLHGETCRDSADIAHLLGGSNLFHPSGRSYSSRRVG